MESAAIGESCTFTDVTQCGFTQNATESTLTWDTYPAGRQQLRTPLIPYDHTTGTSLGAYLFIDLENQGENLNGRLFSPVYQTAINQSYCVEFYYVLVGSNNSFNVFTQSNSSARRTIFTRNYDHGYAWNKGEATVSSANPFRIGFEIITGYLRQGLVSLDDYSIRAGQCGFRADECTFDDGSLCSWTNAAGNQFDWLVIKGSTPTLDTGPDNDHSECSTR